MFTINQYIRPATLAEAYELNQKKGATVLGGLGWLKMSHRRIQTAIDLSNLGLDGIEETDEQFRLGAMVTLRQLELDGRLSAYYGDCIPESVRNIVGVQFRNCATIGGSIWGRFGFSDPLTCFLALGAQVELVGAGVVELADFVQMRYDRDILSHIILPKRGQKTAVRSMRLTATDFPILVCAVTKEGETVRAAVGARPQRAALRETEAKALADPQTFAEKMTDGYTFGSNLRGSAAYRQHLCRVLLTRAASELKEETGCS